MARTGPIAFRAAASGGKLLLPFVVVQAARAAYAEYQAAIPRRGPVERPADGTLPPSARDIAFPTKRRHRIRGWWIPGQNGAAIICVGGSGSDRSGLLREARIFADGGYSVLTYDHPGHGESEGSPDWVVEIPDALVSALDWVSVQRGVYPKRIGALGFSMGGATVTAVAVRDSRVAAVVLSGAYTDADEQARHEYRRWGKIQSTPAIWVMRAFGIPAGALRPVDQVASIAPRPVLLIAGSHDGIVPASMAHELFAAAREPKKLWIVDGARHGDFADAAGSEYSRRLLEFFDGALGA